MQGGKTATNLSLLLSLQVILAFRLGCPSSVTLWGAANSAVPGNSLGILLVVPVALPSSCSIPGSAGLSIPPAHTICLLTPGASLSPELIPSLPQTQEQNFPPLEISAAPDFLKEHNNGKRGASNDTQIYDHI